MPNPTSMIESEKQGRDQTEWTQAAEKAKDAAACATEMASHAASAVGTMASNAACDVGKKADELTANAGAGIQGWGDTIAKNTPHSGMLGTASQAVARTVKEGGEYLQEAKLSGLTEDLTQLIKRNPVPAVCVALGLGWLMASRLRS